MLVLPTLQSQHGDAGGYPVHTVLSLAEKHKDRQATLNSRPFLVPHSNTQQHKNSFIVPTMTDWNHLSDDQAKAPVLEDFKWLITTVTSVCTLPSHHITKGRSCDISQSVVFCENNNNKTANETKMCEKICNNRKPTTLDLLYKYYVPSSCFTRYKSKISTVCTPACLRSFPSIAFETFPTVKKKD